MKSVKKWTIKLTDKQLSIILGVLLETKNQKIFESIRKQVNKKS